MYRLVKGGERVGEDTLQTGHRWDSNPDRQKHVHGACLVANHSAKPAPLIVSFKLSKNLLMLVYEALFFLFFV